MSAGRVRVFFIQIGHQLYFTPTMENRIKILDPTLSGQGSIPRQLFKNNIFPYLDIV